MKKLVVGLLILWLSGCVSIPSEDIVVLFQTPYGGALGIILKGELDEKNKGKSWIPLKEEEEEEREEETI